MSYYNSNTYFYPRIRTKNIKINHIVDYTPEECKSTYKYRTIEGCPIDAFYFKPSSRNSKEKNKRKYGNINEINKTYNEPYKFNENGIIRETRNYTLYENKNWTENIQYPVVEYDKIELPPPLPPKPKPKPKPKKIFEKKVEVIKEEIEREEDRKKKYMKSNFIREREYNRNKKKLKYKGKTYIGGKRQYIKESDNIISIYDCKKIGIENMNLLDNNDDNNNEIKKIKKLTEKKKTNENDYKETLTTKKEYKLHKTSTITMPIKK